MSRAMLRALAVRALALPKQDLAQALASVGFVQADPIRAPARAQDLILRHRARDYRAGDLERDYALLGLSEDMLHVYGFCPQATSALLHPRTFTRSWRVEESHPHLRRALMRYLKTSGPTHTRVIQNAFESGPVVNGWGGTSAATTRFLEALHYEGKVRVARRDGGTKVYEIAPKARASASPLARARALVMLMCRLYAPLPRASLNHLLAMVGERAPGGLALRDCVPWLLAKDLLRTEEIDGVKYLWPADLEAAAEPFEGVALLAPFDPIVWDRRRFEHLWDWEYRFEAYTPAALRRYGYYALPMLWRYGVVGWANVFLRDGALEVETGFVGKRPRDAAFRRGLEAEIEQLGMFLRRPA